MWKRKHRLFTVQRLYAKGITGCFSKANKASLTTNPRDARLLGVVLDKVVALSKNGETISIISLVVKGIVPVLFVGDAKNIAAYAGVLGKIIHRDVDAVDDLLRRYLPGVVTYFLRELLDVVYDCVPGHRRVFG